MKFEGEGGGKSNAQMESAIKQTNVVRSRALLEMLEGAIKKYQNNLLTTTEIIQFLVDEVAKKTREEANRAERMGFTKDELAFYDALAENDSATQVLRESARAKLMVIVKRTLTKYGYPSDQQTKAIETVLRQAERSADYLLDSLSSKEKTPSVVYVIDGVFFFVRPKGFKWQRPTALSLVLKTKIL